jgi:formylglycine-generating enzyme required for sulfatase activity
MDEFIKAINEAMPFSGWFQLLGLSKQLSDVLSIAIILGLLWLLGWGVKKLVGRRKNLKAAKDLKPQFDYAAVRQATRIYIPTQYQNASPTRQEEPGFTHQYVSTSPLIPFFINTAFNEKTGSERFYLILADSGMGKTTFMVNLYLSYHSFFNRRRKFKMRLLRFSHPDTMAEIKAIKNEEAKNTILLLDALDEDPGIVSKDPNVTDAQAFQKRVDEIIEATRNFCEVVMTCRTQYFPGQEDDPYEVKVKRPDEKGFYRLNKLYISPFTDGEVKKYLKKKYGYLPFWNRRKKQRAAQVVGHSRNLLVRPMMLSYIDYLVEGNGKFLSDYDIYEALIEKWLVREAEKRKHKVDQESFINSLRSVSQQTAISIWKIWQAEKRMYLTKAEAIGIAEENGIDLKPKEVTGQSLLTCDGAGNWKFAHKSIMEFFLAKEFLENVQFFREFNFAGMDMAKHFFEEKNPEHLVFVEVGTYTMGSPKDETPHSVKVGNFWIGKYQVTQSEYVKTTCKPNPASFKDDDKNPVESVSWLDSIGYCNLLNMKYGFPATYDDQGNLLAATGKVTTEIAKVKGFRLPTAAEWEYAARGGNQSKGYEYSGSNSIKEVAWHDENSGRKTHPVGTLKPNELGLHDMSGNVWEWCHDRYGEKYYDECEAKGTVENPSGPTSGATRVVRGGSWYFVAAYCRSASRYHYSPATRYHFVGFRPVFVPQ